MGGGHNRAHERLADAYICGKDLFSPPKNGHSQPQSTDGAVSPWPGRLLCGWTSTMAGFAEYLPNEGETIHPWRTLLDPRLFLGHGKEDAETSVARAYRFSPG